MLQPTSPSGSTAATSVHGLMNGSPPASGSSTKWSLKERGASTALAVNQQPSTSCGGEGGGNREGAEAMGSAGAAHSALLFR